MATNKTGKHYIVRVMIRADKEGALLKGRTVDVYWVLPWDTESRASAEAAANRTNRVYAGSGDTAGITLTAYVEEVDAAGWVICKTGERPVDALARSGELCHRNYVDRALQSMGPGHVKMAYAIGGRGQR